ncbi:spindle and kinetochore-associated protein 1-like [Cuculus canorus]|uniref:spindle and kinetochore-associated protein 1-like n=1 Tax=Cuculus canorus TaxID=55661 RepID=UPI0023AB16AF|nr:spindle and kinetochore-associated protein 1-like [Cuculus canorus]
MAKVETINRENKVQEQGNCGSAMDLISSLLAIGNEQSLRSVVSNLGQELAVCHGLLVEMEAEVQQQEKLRDRLKMIKMSVERQRSEAEHLQENVPPYLPKPTRSCNTGPAVKREEATKAECTKKSKEDATAVKQMPLISPEEFDNIPAYLRGRLRCEQINVVIQEINNAVAAKYKIMHQPLKSMKAPARKLYSRFLEEEIKETRGEFFIMEADIKEFTQLKMDKRCYNILSILRHAQRLREIRCSGFVRYIIC